MTPHLMALELGPVVTLLAASRKTRDLWFSSHLVSRIAKAVAKAVWRACVPPGGAERHGLDRLIVPAPASIADLEDESEFTMGDELLVIVPADIEPVHVAATARTAAHTCWLEFARNARQRVPDSLMDPLTWARQTEQASTQEVVQVYSAWVPLPDESQYAACLTRVRRLLEGRMRCRDFAAADQSDAGTWKSSLDGRRPTVLVQGEEQRPQQLLRALRLARGEQLDALGVTKRVGGGRMNYPSTARFAADPWIRGACQKFPQDFQKLEQACRALAEPRAGVEPVLARLSVTPGPGACYPQLAEFPFEGAILYSSRHNEFLDEAGEKSEAEPLRDLKAALRTLTSQHGEPGSYYALLMADGDNVGPALARCETSGQHRRFSAQLSQFSQSVASLVANHHGALVYAAGEDVLALLPLADCLECADALRTRYQTSLLPMSDPRFPLTLSVGIAIGHFHEALEDVQAAARSLLFQTAKSHPGKNAIAIQYQSRGGAPTICTQSWTQDPARRVAVFAGQIQGGDLPARIAYEVRRLGESYRSWPGAALTAPDVERELMRRALTADLRRLLSAKSETAREIVESALREIRDPDDVVNLANTLVIAGLIGASQAQRGDFS